MLHSFRQKMNKLSVAFVFLGLASVAFSASVVPREKVTEWEGRIVGGTAASRGQFPHMVSLRTAAGDHFCGGWIHNERWVISAASCNVGRTTGNTRVWVGALTRTDGIPHMTQHILIHPEFRIQDHFSDIAMIWTTTPISFVNGVAPIALLAAHVSGGPATISGWGQISDPGLDSWNLMFLNTEVIDNQRCTQMFGYGIYDVELCTFREGIRGFCMGDHGGPLIAGPFVIGVASWLMGPCARGMPDVYTRVSSFIGWIQDNECPVCGPPGWN